MENVRHLRSGGRGSASGDSALTIECKSLGAIHFDGKYHLTDEPNLREGLEGLQRIGMKLANLGFMAGTSDVAKGYGINSDWPRLPMRSACSIWPECRTTEKPSPWRWGHLS